MSRSYIIHTPDEIARIRRAAKASAWLRDQLASVARPGMSTWELDQAAGALAVMAMIGTVFESSLSNPRMACVASSPSMTGILTSIRMAS